MQKIDCIKQGQHKADNLLIPDCLAVLDAIILKPF